MVLDILNGIRILEVSPQATDIYGYTREEFLKMTAYDIDPILASGGYDHLWRTRFQDFRKGFRVNSVMRTKSGDIFPTQTSVKFIFSDTHTNEPRVPVHPGEPHALGNNSFAMPDFPALKGSGEESRSMKFPVLQQLVRNLWSGIGIKPYAYLVIDCFLGVATMPLAGGRYTVPVTRLSNGTGESAQEPTHFSFSADLDGTCVYVTPDVMHFLGYTQAEVLGNLIFEYMTPKDREKHQTLLLSLVERRAPFRSTIAFLHKDGRTIKMDTCFLPRQDDFGMLEFYEWVCWLR